MQFQSSSQAIRSDEPLSTRNAEMTNDMHEKSPVRRRWRGLLACAAIAAGMASFGARAQQAQDNEFRIGFAMALTGPIAELTKLVMRGAEVQLERINASGGIGGLPVRFVVCDIQSQEAQALLCTRRLIAQDKVHMLIGANGTATTLAAIPAVQSAGVPMFAFAGGKIVYDPLKKWVFKMVTSNDDQNPVMLEYSKHKNWKRAVLIRDGSSFGKDVSSSLLPLLKDYGVELAAEEIYAPSDTDVTAQVARIRALNPDVVYNLASNLSLGALVSRKLVQMGVQAPIVVQWNLQSPAYAELVPEAVGQTYFIGMKAALRDLPASDPMYKNIMDFRQAFQKKYDGAEPVVPSLMTIDPLQIVQQIGKRVGAKVRDPEVLRTELESVENHVGILGIWSFSPTDHGPHLQDGLTMMQFKDHRWQQAN